MTPAPELRKLIDRLLSEGSLGKVETSRLEELLKDREALRYYTETMAQESMMAEALGGAGAGARKVVRMHWKPVAVAAAACVVFGLGFFSGRQGGEKAPSAKDPLPVQVTGVMGVEWDKSGAPELASGGVTAERVAFRTGLVELTYANGVRVTLEGPAEYVVNSPTSGELASGKLVAYVPPGAEGFTVDYARGKVVDLGTEFAMDVGKDGKTELGVFDGEVELHLPGEKPRSLQQSQAVMHEPGKDEALRPIPLDREKFVRHLPARDFRWELTSPQEQEMTFDVTHLIWKPGEYRAIFKWISGIDALVVSDVELRLDGKPVVADLHEGSTGELAYVKDNMFLLNIGRNDFKRGRWTLHMKAKPYPRIRNLATYTGPVGSQGILQFEEGMVTKAQETDFIGRWSYHFLGVAYVREFHADGRVTLTRDGEAVPSSFPDSRWFVEDGVLKIWIPERNAYEWHVLRDAGTLVFTTNPYGNARKLE